MADRTAQTKAVFDMCMTLHGRLDTLWQRLLYAHAAIVGVLVFFSTQADPFWVSRALVFVFYTINLAISVTAMLESYRGLQAGLADLKAMEADGELSHFEAWLMTLDYAAHPMRRIVLFGLVWSMLAYLLFSSLLA